MLIWMNSPRSVHSDFLFLDRDGVLNVDRPDYVKSKDEFTFYDDALEALRWLRANGVATILVSNQSGLQRGIISWSDFWDLHHWMVDEIRRGGGEILAAFFCPHHPQTGCHCRKPAPGMLLEAARIYQIDLERTHLIGDRPKDLLAARNAGCRGIYLDRAETGLQETEMGLPPTESIPTYSTLLQAVQAVLENRRP